MGTERNQNELLELNETKNQELDSRKKLDIGDESDEKNNLPAKDGQTMGEINGQAAADAFADALFIEEPSAVRAGYFKIFGWPSLLYAIVYTVCMFRNSSSITMPVWVAATILYACVVMKQISAGNAVAGLKAGSWFYITVMLLLGIATFLTDQPYMICFNYIGFFVMLLLFLLHNFYDDRQWDFSKSLMEMASAVFGAVGCMVVPFTDGYAFCQEKKVRKNKTLRAVLIGLLLAVPGILFLGFCLMCADAVFDTMVTKLFSFSSLRVPVNVMEAAGMLLFGYFSSYCGMRYLIRRSHIQTSTHKTAFDPVIAMTFAGLLLVMYLVFCGVQVLYLFAGNMQLPAGLTYAEYAHRGFYMLLFVCVVNFGLVLFIRKYFAAHKILDGMLLIICGCTFIMIASSAYRMYLYIAAYQLTFLRVLVMAALAALALLMAGVVLMICKPVFPLFRYSLAVVSVLYLCLAFWHVDGFIASYNLSHAQETEHMDWSYLSRLSLDAAPAVADYYVSASTQTRKKMELAAQKAKLALDADGYWTGLDGDGADGLEEMYWFEVYMRKLYRAENNLGLRSFNLSRYRAVTEMKSNCKSNGKPDCIQGITCIQIRK